MKEERVGERKGETKQEYSKKMRINGGRDVRKRVKEAEWREEVDVGKGGARG
jgi:hypothetical protein